MLPEQPLIQTSTVFPFKNGCYGNNGILKGKGAMPGHFYPSSVDNMFSMNRSIYSRTANSESKNTVVANKPVHIQDSSLRTMAMRYNAIGKSSENVKGGKLGFSGADRNDVYSALVKARRIGAAAPAKKGFYPKN
tara:strand:+ start:388 stop:792 length:405 start_codon:yes stop_codon:yes gene_type:complete